MSRNLIIQKLKALEEIISLRLLLILLFPSLHFFGDPFLNLDLKASLYVVVGLPLVVFLVNTILKGEGESKNKERFLFVVGVYILILVASTIFSIYPLHSLLGGAGYRGGILIIISCISIGFYFRNHAEQRFNATLWLVGIIIGIQSLLMNYKVLLDGARLIGPIYQANVLAAYLGVAYFAGFSLFNRSRNKLQIISFLFIQLFYLFLIFLTQSRYLLLLVFLFTVLLAVSARREISALIKERLKSNLSFEVGLVGMAIIALSMFLALSNQTGFINRISDKEKLQEGFGYRFDLITHGTKIIPETPLVGWGADSIIFVFDQVKELPDRIKVTYEQEGSVADSSHNIIVDQFLQFGLFGGITYIIIFCLVFLSIYQADGGSSYKVKILLPFLFIVAQGFLNPNAIEVELLFWLFAWRGIQIRK